MIPGPHPSATLCSHNYLPCKCVPANQTMNTDKQKPSEKQIYYRQIPKSAILVEFKSTRTYLFQGLKMLFLQGELRLVFSPYSSNLSPCLSGLQQPHNPQHIGTMHLLQGHLSWAETHIISRLTAEKIVDPSWWWTIGMYVHWGGRISEVTSFWASQRESEKKGEEEGEEEDNQHILLPRFTRL